jgi:hypothetical protein
VSGLTNATTYTFVVEAVNGYGISSPTTGLNLTPEVLAAPDAVRNLTTQTALEGTSTSALVVSWSAPPLGGCDPSAGNYTSCEVNGYTVTYQEPKIEAEGAELIDKSVTVPASSLSTTIQLPFTPRPSSGPWHIEVTVTASNKAGKGPDTSSMLPLELTPAVPVLVATGGADSVTLSWKVPANETTPEKLAGPTTSYSIFEGTTMGGESATPLPTSDFTVTSTQSPLSQATNYSIKIRGLTTGTTYYFTMVLTDAAGPSAPTKEVGAEAQ